MDALARLPETDSVGDLIDPQEWNGTAAGEFAPQEGIRLFALFRYDYGLAGLPHRRHETSARLELGLIHACTGNGMGRSWPEGVAPLTSPELYRDNCYLNVRKGRYQHAKG